MSNPEETTTSSEEAIQDAVNALRGGNLAVLPTDTVYGLAADAFDTVGTARIFTAKDRSRRLPLPVLVRSPKQVIGLVSDIPVEADRLMAAFWPGPLTIVMIADPNLTWDLGESDGTVAVRMPLDEVMLQVIRQVGPLAVTSANRSGHPAATTIEQAREQLGDLVVAYLDDGPRGDLAPSTIVDLTRAKPNVVRAGSLDSDEVLAVARGELGPHEVSLPGSAADPVIGGDDLDDAVSG